MAAKQVKVQSIKVDTDFHRSLSPYKGVIRPEHVLAYGPEDSHMIMLLLVDSHMLNAYWPKYVKNSKGVVYVRGALQDVPDHLTKEVYAAREYQTLASFDTIHHSTLDMLELR